MTYSIHNEKLKVGIKAIGAELSSIQKKSNKKEYLWQGNPSIWASQAPVLFPIIGGLKDETYIYQNKEYTLPKHGFIRYNEDMVAKDHSDTKVAFSLMSSEKTMAMYPFNFHFEISYELIDNELLVSHHIKNMGKETMYFSVGGHPAFNCPLEDSEKYEDYHIKLENSDHSKSYVLSPEGLISEDTFSIIKDNTIKLTETIFDNDALIFKNINAKKATLTHQTKGAILSVAFKDFPDLGIWAKPKAPFVCIEPWLGYADVIHTDQRLEQKEGIKQLKAGQVLKSAYTIRIY